MSRSQGPKSTISEETWGKWKYTIYGLYIKENIALRGTMDKMSEHWGFRATWAMYNKKCKRWGFVKNMTQSNQGVVDGIEKRHPRHRNNDRTYIRKVYQRYPITPKASPTNTNRERIVGIVRELLDQLFGSDACGWSVDVVAIVPPAGWTLAQAQTWELLSHQCNFVPLLARTGMQRCLLSAIQQVFDGVNHAASQQNPYFLVYFWKIALELRDIRLHREQKSRRKDFPLLAVFLKYLRLCFSRHFKTHLLVDFMTWLENTFNESPSDFKGVFEWVYLQTIACFKRKIGGDHPIILGMTSHHASKWTRKTAFPRTTIQGIYHSLSGRVEATFGPRSERSISLLLDYMSAMAISDSRPSRFKATKSRNENQFEETMVIVVRTLAIDLRLRTLSWCREHERTILAYTPRTRAFALATDWLSNYYFEHKHPETPEICYDFLEEAINILWFGDDTCHIWAAHFSKRLCLWYKSRRHHKKAPKGQTERFPEKDFGSCSMKNKDGDLCPCNGCEASRAYVIEGRRLKAILKSVPQHSAPKADHDHSKCRGMKRSKCRRKMRRKEAAGLFPYISKYSSV